MAITFRDLKGSALTHPEMDTNLASYYLSSSVSGSTITFFQSGSNGNVISSSHDLADSDAQTLNIVGNQLTISNGNTVSVPTGSDTTYTEGTGIDITDEVITNTAPDQEIILTQGGATTITGTYPNFTISSSDTDTTYTNLSEFTNDVGYITSSEGTLYTAGEGLNLNGTVFSNTLPDQTVTLAGQNITVNGVYPDFQITGSDQSTDVTLTGTPSYITISGQVITRNQINLTTDVTGILPVSNMSATALTTVQTATDETDMLSKTAQEGDVIVRSDEVKTYMHNGGTAGTMADFTLLATPTDSVTSVNGNTGVVTVLEDQTVSISGDGITVNGTYPNFQLTGSSNDTTYSAGTGLSLVGTTFNNTAPDQTVAITGQNITVNGSYPNFQLTGSLTDITSLNSKSGSWDTAYGWGDHSQAGYITEDTNTQLSDADIAAFGYIKTYTDTDTTYTAGTGLTLTGTVFSNDITDNNQLTNGAGYITGYTETDTLASVVARGSTTPNSITAANFITTSDRRLKSDIEPLKDGLDTIKKFVSYEYTKGGVQDAGFIAQEVQEAIPYAIAEGEDGFLTMRDRPVLAYMHKAILELEARLAAIEEKLN